MLRAALLSLLLAGPALAQDPEAPVRQPLDPALNGTWEMVEMNVPDADLDVVSMVVTFDGSETTTRMTFRVDGELQEETVTSDCASFDGVIGCVSTGDKPGRHSGLGVPEITGDTLRFTLPRAPDYAAVFRRVE